jgi:hypothetical protein
MVTGPLNELKPRRVVLVTNSPINAGEGENVPGVGHPPVIIALHRAAFTTRGAGGALAEGGHALARVWLDAIQQSTPSIKHC